VKARTDLEVPIGDLRLNSLPRVSILTANAGGGHLAAAESLAEALAGEARVSILRLMDDHTPFPISRFSAGYGPLVHYAPRLYHIVYRFAAARSRLVLTERAIYPLVRRRMDTVLRAEEADLWISVHHLQIDTALWLLREQGSTAPFVTVVTDPVTAPVAWFSPEVDLCVVATEAARDVALACKIPLDRVRVIGLPIRRAFAEMRGQPKGEVRSHLGLAPDRPLILMSGGGAGVGRLLQIARAVTRALRGHRARPQVAIIAGRNSVLERQLRAETWPIPVTVLGYVNNMAEWLVAADLLITKAGPGALAEAACLGTPTLITGYIPGQESGNVTWAAEHGAGVFEPEIDRIADLVAEWLRPGNPELARMSAAANELAQPDAARQIAQAALGLLKSSAPPSRNLSETHRI
jgi:1,2-diacylglycerol 3-beta-galactosyltransferase